MDDNTEEQGEAAAYYICGGLTAFLREADFWKESIKFYILFFIMRCFVKIKNLPATYNTGVILVIMHKNNGLNL